MKSIDLQAIADLGKMIFALASLLLSAYSSWYLNNKAKLSKIMSKNQKTKHAMDVLDYWNQFAINGVHQMENLDIDGAQKKQALIQAAEEHAQKAQIDMPSQTVFGGQIDKAVAQMNKDNYSTDKSNNETNVKIDNSKLVKLLSSQAIKPMPKQDRITHWAVDMHEDDSDNKIADPQSAPDNPE